MASLLMVRLPICDDCVVFKCCSLLAVVEHVRDGCTIRAFVLPTFQYVTVLMSGIKCPMFQNVGEKAEAEPFAEEAKFYTESRLLQRNVQIVLEGASTPPRNQATSAPFNQNLIGSVLHPVIKLSVVQRVGDYALLSTEWQHRYLLAEGRVCPLC